MGLKRSLGFGVLSTLVFAWGGIGFADANLPTCKEGNAPIASPNNAQVLQWKFNSKNAYKDRALVSGKVTVVFPDRNGHEHFEISLGSNPKDTLEVIYNIEFGPLPHVQVGMDIMACGDYITSNAPNGGYQASPSGAIIHWVHVNPKGRGHEDGFVSIQGQVYGTDPAYAKRAGERFRDRLKTFLFLPAQANASL